VTRLHAFCRFLLPTAALAAALFVAGCGVKGPLELPEGSTKVSGNEGKGGFVSSPKAELPGYYQSQMSGKNQKAQKQLGKPAKPDEPFVLDPLLN
jgi:predicted small lipoprotein YifL